MFLLKAYTPTEINIRVIPAIKTAFRIPTKLASDARKRPPRGIKLYVILLRLTRRPLKLSGTNRLIEVPLAILNAETIKPTIAAKCKLTIKLPEVAVNRANSDYEMSRAESNNGMMMSEQRLRMSRQK